MEGTKQIEEDSMASFNEAVQTIKTAILRSQYKAARAVNAEQLSLYYGIGRYVSFNSRKGYWGTGAIDNISRQLQKELPGLRGFSLSNLKNMRKFFEAWEIYLNRQPLAGDLLTTIEQEVISDEIDYRILLHTNRQPLAADLNLNDFLSISFSHHIEIIAKAKDTEERLFYIHQTLKNHWNKYSLRAHLEADDFHHQGTIPNNFKQTLPDSKQSLRAIEMFKDQYLLDFINVEELDARDSEEIDERVVEKANGCSHLSNPQRDAGTFAPSSARCGRTEEITLTYKASIMKHSLLLLLLLFCSAGYAQQQDSVTISGRVTDYAGQPIDSAIVWWQSPRFKTVIEAISSKDGSYTARVPKGKYQSVASIYWPSYAHVALKSGLPEAEHRLEFWAWDFIADRDTTLNIRYNRMEAYGLRVFRIPGGIPAYQIYVRPISLTRTYQWMKETQPASMQNGEDLSNIELQQQSKEAKERQMAPHTEQLKVTVWIDGEEVPILMKQEIKEYAGANEYMNAYLLTVDMPKHPKADLPYHIFKVELEDLENGDRGEGLYYMEKENYVK